MLLGPALRRKAGIAPGAVLAAAFVAGCVAQDGTGAARRATAPAMGAQVVQIDGQSLTGMIGTAGNGIALTAAGSRPVAGYEVQVTRAGNMRRDEGALAKKAARASCVAAGGSFQETALGRFDRAGSWIFAGGCA